MLFNRNTENNTYLVVGLGNIGERYDGTRHNIGFCAVDRLSKALSAPIPRAKFSSLTTGAKLGGFKVVIMKPTTFMNLSGKAVLEAVSFYKLPSENVIVFTDDISLGLGSVRIRAEGSHGGHNGLRDIAIMLSTERYTRVRIGVGAKPHPNYDLADWVLGRFTQAENTELEAVLEKVPDIVLEIMKNGVASAQNRYGKTVRSQRGGS